MRRSICLLFLLACLFVFSGCNGQQPFEAGTPETTSAPETTEMKQKAHIVNTNYIKETNISKDNVSEFMALLGGDIELGGLMSGFVLDEEHCYNVTPKEVALLTDMQIFKFSDSCMSFVMYDEEIHMLCEYFGGYGFVSAIPCDFDTDGHFDLLVTSSWGSGMHRSIVSIFNSVTKESTTLYTTLNSNAPDTDLIVLGTTVARDTFSMNMPMDYGIYSVDVEVNQSKGINFADLSCRLTGFVGSVEVENGAPVFKPYSCS